MSHYDTLGVPRDADAATLKAAHRRLAAAHHPDKPGGDTARFQAIQSAYDTLKDDDKRAHYDRTGKDSPAQRSETAEIAPLVMGAFDRSIAEVGANFKKRDIIAKMKAHLEGDVARGVQAISENARHKNDIDEMLRRLGYTGEEGKNILAAGLTQRARDVDELIAKNNATVDLVNRAIKHVELYGWEVDPEPQVFTSFFTGGQVSSYHAELIQEMMRSSSASIWSSPRRMPRLMPGVELKVTAKPPKQSFTKARKHRRTWNSSPRPHTFTIDPETGKQTPAARGSWREFERRAATIQQEAHRHA